MLYKDLHLYKGAIHIHTKLSDGTGDIQSITQAAQKANLDFIIITDHNYYDTSEGFINGVCVIKGEEISPQNNNHYLAFNIDRTIEPNTSPNVCINQVRQLGGFGFAAHPDEGLTVDRNGNVIPRKNSFHCIPWTDKNIEPDGIEIWNWFSNWADNLNDSNIITLAYSYLFKHNIIKSPSNTTLEWWDKLNKKYNKIIPAIGGVDAHALKIYKYIVPVTVFPYKTCFNTITNVICLKESLSDDFFTAKKQILNALRCGNNIIYNRKILNYFPEIYITNSDNAFYCGDNLHVQEQCVLHFHSKKEMKISLVYNGTKVKEYITNNFTHTIDKSGKYRIVAKYKNRDFLYTNPFNIIKRDNTV